MRFKITSFCFIFTTLLFFYSTKIQASSNFSSSYDITYEVDESGITRVTQEIDLTNLTSNYYANAYSMTFDTNRIGNIHAFDKLKELNTEIKRNGDQTIINVIFGNIVAGIGKTYSFKLQYESSEIAQKINKIWEINIPAISNKENPVVYNVSLIIPQSLGIPEYIFPPPQKDYFWTLPKSSQGISLGFGNAQDFDFFLKYHLKNSSLIPKNMDITLPPNTSYQEVSISDITPKPTKVYLDRDGNWLATYFLLPKQNIEIDLKGKAQVFAKPQKNSNLVFEEANNLSDYLKPQRYWEISPKIKDIAQRLKTPENIYSYVVSTLGYDYQKASGTTERGGALNALEFPNESTCIDFTDLFISLARAAGIPAREVDGFAYTQNSRLKPLSLITDILHAWPEYWDRQQKLWIQVDPTWGKTTRSDYFHRFDFNHLAFSIRGISSNSPYPAGSYRGEKEGKDVFVDFSQSFTINNSSPIVLTEKDENMGFNSTKTIVIVILLIIFVPVISLIIVKYGQRSKR